MYKGDTLLPYRTVPYRTVPYRTVPYRNVPYRTVPSCFLGAYSNFALIFPVKIVAFVMDNCRFLPG